MQELKSHEAFDGMRKWTLYTLYITRRAWKSTNFFQIAPSSDSSTRRIRIRYTLI